ncbi:hypothetical protein JCM24511_08490 [Saitozyma sp. JCM 24511]|nr:hypothetical protein JCM24511_08490 [Saitozyma sp. JCM 24511]
MLPEPSRFPAADVPADGHTRGEAAFEVFEFVRGQLKHYGLDLEERDVQGNGVALMKKVLKAGKMSKEWFAKVSLREMGETFPVERVKMYFLDEMGNPDQSKTMDGLAVPLPPFSRYRVGRLCEAVEKVPGLHHERDGDTLLVGWDITAMTKVWRADQAKRKTELEKQKREEKEQRYQMALLHTGYAKTVARPKSDKATPVGSYFVECEVIEEEGPDDSRVYEAAFDFGIVEGAMVLSSDRGSLKSHLTRLDKHCRYEDADELGEDEEEEDEEDEEDEEEELVEEGARPGKRKAASAAKPRDRPWKKAKATKATKATSATSARKLFLACRGCETGEGQIHSTPSNWTMSFDAKFASFSGTFDFAHIGEDVPIKGRKVSDEVPRSQRFNSWNDYSESAYESARMGRWNSPYVLHKRCTRTCTAQVRMYIYIPRYTTVPLCIPPPFPPMYKSKLG